MFLILEVEVDIAYSKSLNALKIRLDINYLM